MPLTDMEQELLEQINKGELRQSNVHERENKPPATDLPKSKKRKHSEESSSDEDDDEDGGDEDLSQNNWFCVDENCQLVNEASSFLGFQFLFEAGRDCNGEGFSFIKLLEPVHADEWTVSAFSPHDLIELEKKVAQEYHDNLNAFLTMIGCADEKLSWYLYPSHD